ncbi:hypothetical protein [Legionella septentrionalis]|uniref:Uncharacterized protein n=1 Tax=Legionella septentrionalis TaxID=2498109 RepID=A0A3S0VME3_9GAMM|nr:hypothetical protein [Legionella septentrionalis]RUQ81871.1 hypothetical protein EKM59_09280 [Legionella septentrionalis]RUR00241.1 hypothetical protein ELY11_02510 [Legionella septentrionalis]
MPILLFNESQITAENYQEFCKQNGKDPKQCVFVFPGNPSHHTPEHTLFSVKEGKSNLNAVAQRFGEAGFPTLSLPTVLNQDISLPQRAMADLWRAAGAGYTIILPVRPFGEKGQYFNSPLSKSNNYAVELNFWGGNEGEPNPGLGHFYNTYIVNLHTFLHMRETGEPNRAQHLQNFSRQMQGFNLHQNLANSYTTGELYPQDAWLQPPQPKPSSTFSPYLLLAIGSGVLGAAGAATIVVGALALAQVIAILCPPVALLAAGAVAAAAGMAGVGLFAYKHSQSKNHPIEPEPHLGFIQ